MAEIDPKTEVPVVAVDKPWYKSLTKVGLFVLALDQCYQQISPLVGLPPEPLVVSKLVEVAGGLSTGVGLRNVLGRIALNQPVKPA